jgi:hypothetical protein
MTTASATQPALMALLIASIVAPKMPAERPPQSGGLCHSPHALRVGDYLDSRQRFLQVLGLRVHDLLGVLLTFSTQP